MVAVHDGELEVAREAEHEDVVAEQVEEIGDTKMDRGSNWWNTGALSMILIGLAKDDEDVKEADVQDRGKREGERMASNRCGTSRSREARSRSEESSREIAEDKVEEEAVVGERIKFGSGSGSGGTSQS